MGNTLSAIMREYINAWAGNSQQVIHDEYGKITIHLESLTRPTPAVGVGPGAGCTYCEEQVTELLSIARHTSRIKLVCGVEWCNSKSMY